MSSWTGLESMFSTSIMNKSDPSLEVLCRRERTSASISDFKGGKKKLTLAEEESCTCGLGVLVARFMQRLGQSWRTAEELIATQLMKEKRNSIRNSPLRRQSLDASRQSKGRYDPSWACRSGLGHAEQ